MTERYVRPVVIPNDMGGEDTLDIRLQEVQQLLEYMPEGIATVLDVGMGKGQLAEYLAGRGCNVTGTGLEIESYGINISEWARKGIKVVPCSVESMPFEDGTFDAVLASHLLEHCHNCSNALKEMRRVLKKDGYLLLFLPPYSTVVEAGHVSIGWNLGELIYVLLINGFNVKCGKFIHYGSSLCAFVPKDIRPLPPLRGDRGDIHILHDAGLFPFKIAKEYRGSHDAFQARKIMSVNWDNAETIIKQKKQKVNSSRRLLSRIIIWICEMMILLIGSSNAVKLGDLILSLAEEEQYNPKEVSL